MTENKKFDVAVIGAGPGGYTAAIRAAQLGKSVALIEKGSLGGTCLNVGCIPSKALLSSAAILHQVRRAAEFGIVTGPVSFHYDQMKARKDGIVSKIRSSLEGLLKSNKISLLHGAAQFESPRELKVMGKDNLFVQADHIIIATGSVPADIQAFPCDHRRILNSTSLLEITEAPKSLAIIGGGYIGCEFASLFAELGSKVTIFEALSSILALQGAEIAQFMTRSFSAKGIGIHTGVSVQSVETRESHVRIALTNGQEANAELCLVSVGRKVCTNGLMLEKAGLKTDGKGFLAVNDRMETEVKGIYAVGDVTGKSMLAHVASHQGMAAASRAAGLDSLMRYDAIPAVIFTSPEVATVGLTAEMAAKAGFHPVTGTFPFKALGKAQAALETDGFSQIVSDRKTGQILGAAVIGHDASNLIAEMALAIQNELTLDCVIETIHAHPTMAESWLESALLAAERPMHFPPKGR